MNRKLFALLVGTLFLSACSLYRIDADETSLDFFPSKSSGKDIVYLEKVDRPYEVLGTLTVNTERRWDKDEVIQKLKREAAFIGGDAITNIQEKPPALKGKLSNAYLRTNYTADVVRFSSPSAAEKK